MTKVESTYKKIGKRIEAARKEHVPAMTQGALADKVGISRPALANMIAGRQRIYLHHVLKLQRVLKKNLIMWRD